MSSYEELLKEKSLDKLLMMANEEKNSLIKGKTDSILAGNGEAKKADFLPEIEKLLDYFNLCMPFNKVYSHLKKLQDINITQDIFLLGESFVSGRELNYLSNKYIDRMSAFDFKRGFVVGDKIVTVFSEKQCWIEEYFDDRNRAFPFGSIGEIGNIKEKCCFVSFSFPPESDWPMVSRPQDKNRKWETMDGASDNAKYKEDELRFVPLNLVEKKRIMYEANNLAQKIGNFERARK